MALLSPEAEQFGPHRRRGNCVRRRDPDELYLSVQLGYQRRSPSPCRGGAQWGRGRAIDQGGILTLIRCSFQSNHAATKGGGLFTYTNATVTNCSFQSNSATTGGGLYNLGSSPVLTNCSFQANAATTGRGIYNINKSTPTLSNCILFGNGGAEHHRERIE